MSENSIKIEQKRNLPASFWIFVIVAVVMLLVGIGGAYSCFVISIGAVIAALLRWPFAGSLEAFELSEEGLIKSSDAELLAWASLKRVSISGKCLDPDLLASDSKGTVTAHFEKQDVPLQNSEDVFGSNLYRQLWDIVLADSPVLLTNAAIVKHYHEQVEKYGKDDVLASSGGSVGKAQTGNIKIDRRLLLGMCTLTLSGFLGFAIFSDQGFPVVFGVICLIMLILLAFFSLKSDPQGDGSEMVMSPDGLTLMSKSLKGALKWAEVKSIKLIPKPVKPVQLKISVEGAGILLCDNFQHPAWYLKRKAEAFTNKSFQLNSNVAKAEFGSVANADQVKPIETGNPFQPPRS